MTHQHRTGSIRLGLLASAIATLIGPLAPEVHAQRALGDGRVLDNNPRVGSGGRNTQRQSFQRELEFRNAIATGNAPGGLSFRGDIGYRAPGEFRGELGSDALFAFRRDSLYSGLAGMGIRGTDALQYQFSMTTGSRVTNNLIGSSSYTRLGRVTTSADAATRTLDTRAGSPFRSRELGIDADTRDTRSADTESALSGAYTTGTLRSTSAYRSTGSLNPEILSTYEQGIGRDKYAVVSSPLTGLTTTPLEDEQSTNDRARRSLDQRVPTSYDESAERALERAKALRDEALGREPDPGSDTERDAEDDAETSDWMRGKFLDLQRQLQGVEDPEESESDADADGSDDDAAGGPTVPPTKIRFTDRIDPTDNTTFTIDPETLEIIRANDEEITYLINPEAETRDIYTEHMRAGEDLLSAGRYFDAEERFTSALSIRSGDVPAQLGRLHAQIGAGLVMSGVAQPPFAPEPAPRDRGAALRRRPAPGARSARRHHHESARTRRAQGRSLGHGTRPRARSGAPRLRPALGLHRVPTRSARTDPRRARGRLRARRPRRPAFRASAPAHLARRGRERGGHRASPAGAGPATMTTAEPTRRARLTGRSLRDFWTDGSVSRLCAALSEVSGVRVELRDESGLVLDPDGGGTRRATRRASASMRRATRLPSPRARRSRRSAWATRSSGPWSSARAIRRTARASSSSASGRCSAP